MRVLHLTHTDLRFDNRILKELKSIASLTGYTVQGVGVSRDFDNGPVHLTSGDYNIVNIRILSANLLHKFRLLKFIFFFIEFFIRTIRLLMRYNADVIHCHDTFVLPIGSFCANITGAKLVYDAHELESNKFGQGIVLSKITLFIERICWRKIDRFITVSHGINTWYMENLGLKNSLVIFNAPYLTVTNNDSSNYFNEKYGISNDSKCYVFVGALERGRKIQEILEVFTELDSTHHVVFLGFGDLVERVRSFANEYDNIHYHEPVSHEQVIHLIRGSYAGFCLIENVSLSDFLSMPNKFFEYINANVPPIVFDFPDLSRFVRQHNFGCVFEENYPLKKQIENMKIISGTTKNMTFSWKLEEKKLLEMYKNL